MQKPTIRSTNELGYMHLFTLVTHTIAALVNADQTAQAVDVLIGWQKLTRPSEVMDLLSQYVEIEYDE